MAGLLRGVMCCGVVASLLGSATTAAASSSQLGMSFLDDGVVRVGVNLDDGGKIAYLAASSGEEGANAQNLVMEVEPAFSAGPLTTYGIGWGANQDWAPVLAHYNDGSTIYAKSAPSSCECAIETWVRLRGAVVSVRNRLTTFRSDTTRYPATWQELPALYTTGRTYRIYSYDGPAPYTNAPLTEVTAFAGQFFQPTNHTGLHATEHWAAIVGDDRFGVGIVEPMTSTIVAIPGTEEAAAYPWSVNGYLAPAEPEIIDANADFSLSYSLVVGSLESIRAYALRHRVDPRPDYTFTHDRRDWSYFNATDRGFPIHGALRMNVDQEDPQLVGPQQWWRAASVRSLYVRGAWHTAQAVAQLFWSVPDGAFSEGRSVRFSVRNDGRFHTYRLRLAGVPTYGGIVDQLRLDPVSGGDPGWVDVECISWKPCRAHPAVEKGLQREGRLVPYLDSFDNGIAQSFRPVVLPQTGSGGSVDDVDGRLELALASATKLSAEGYYSFGVDSKCELVGDYDAQVDYTLLDWSPDDRVNVDFSVGDRTVFRHDRGVSSYFPPETHGGLFVGTEDSQGTLRLVRHGRYVEGYYRVDGDWISLGAGTADYVPQRVSLGLFTNNDRLSHDVRVAFDNLRVNRGRLLCTS
jgi:hypothetical protein